MAIPDKVEWDDETGSWVAATGKPGAENAYWDGSQWVRGKNPEGPGALRRGFATGIESTKGLVADVIPAMVQQALGYEAASKKNLEEYKKRMDDLKAKNLLAISDINSIKDVSSFLSFAGEAIGEAIPSLATSVLGGVGAASGAARLGAGRILSNQVAKRAAELEGKGLATEKALEVATKEASQRVGGAVGAFGGSALLNIPESYASLAEAGDANLGAAFAVGTLKSSLDALGPIRLLSKARGPEFSDKLTDLISARLLKNRPGTAGLVGGSLETFALEGLTEGTQELLDQTAASILADKTIDWDQILTASLKGGIGGAPVGGAVGAYSRRRQEAATQQEAAEKQAAEEARIQAEEAQKRQRQQETEEAFTFPEDYARTKDFGIESSLVGGKAIPAKDIPRNEKGEPIFGIIPPEYQGEDDTTPLVFDRKTESWRPRTPQEAAASQPQYLDRLVSKLARHYNMSREEEAALVNMSRGEGDARLQFENFVAEAVKDPAAVSKIPELSNFDFTLVQPEKATPLGLPAPSGFAYDVPDVGILTPKQADAYINSFISRPVMEGADTRDREQKLQQLRQLDPEVNPEAATIDPNDRRRFALNIITGVDIQQIQQPVETRLPSGETVTTMEGVDRVTVPGQAGTREGTTRTYENAYQRIVDNIPNAEGTLGLSWLKKSAGFKNLQPPSDPNDKEAAKAYAADKALGDAVTANAPKIWQQLINEGYVTKQGMAFKANQQRTQQKQESQFSRNVDTLTQALQAVEKSPIPGTSGVVVKGAPTGRLDLQWLERTLNRPKGSISVEEAKRLWAALEEKKLVYRDGMYYRPGQKATQKPPAPKPPTPPPPPLPPPTPPPPVAKPKPKPAPKAKPPQPPKPVATPTPVPQPTATGFGTLPPNLPPAKWNPTGSELQPNQVTKSDSQLEVEASRDWPKLKSIDAKVQHLRAKLLAESHRTGYEHVAVFDPATGGQILLVHTDNQTHGVGIPPNSVSLVTRPDNQFILSHTHPSNGGTSGADVSAFYASRGISLAFAHGSRGADAAIFTSLGSLRKNLSEYDNIRFAVRLGEYFSLALQDATFWVANNITDATASRSDRHLMAVRLANLAVTRTGLVDFADTNPDSLKVLPGWETFIQNHYLKWAQDSGLLNLINKLDAASDKQRDTHGKRFVDNYYRSSGLLRQPGGVEKLLQDIGAAPPKSSKRSADERIPGVSEDSTEVDGDRETSRIEPRTIRFESDMVIPEGTPQQMQKRLDSMFGRMQRLQEAADDAIPDDYSCG